MDYKEKLELARDWYNDQSTTNKEKVLLETLFPELKEGERIREAIINHLKQDIELECTLSEDEGYKWIAWLEKQSEISPILSDSSNIGKNGQKPAEWSDIDERAMGIIGIALRHYDMDGKWDRRFALDWLNSLKNRVQPHWKPNDEQMQSLYFAIITYSKKDDCKLTYDGLNSLYDDLKNL